MTNDKETTMSADDHPRINRPLSWLLTLSWIVKAMGITLVFALAIGAAIYIGKKVVNTPDDGVKEYSGNLVIDRALAVRSIPSYQEHSNTLCDGDETICTTLITASPADSLQSLIAAIPKGEAKHYKIRLSVVPIEEYDEPEEVKVERSAAPELIAPPSTN